MALSTIQNNSFADTAVHGYRNLVINGAMVISERYGTAVQSPAPSGYGIDRWATYKSGSGTFSIQQSTDGPSGFSNSALITVTSNSTPSGGDYYIYSHKIEGYNTAQLDWGTSDAKDVTLSFWVKSSVTGTFSGSFRPSPTSYTYVFEYTVSSANTWEYKSINISGATVGTWNSTNGSGVNILFSLGQGTTYATSTVGSWVSGNFHGSTTETDLIATSSATWQVTGVQLEVGSQATPFEHRSFGDELRRCQRYFYRFGDGAGATGTVFGNAIGQSSTAAAGVVVAPVEFRGSPSATANVLAIQDTTNVHNVTSVTIRNDLSSNNRVIYLVLAMSGGGATAFRPYFFTTQLNGYLDLDAEL